MHNSTGGLPYPCSQASHISTKGHSATNEQSVKVMLCPKIRELLPPLDYMKPLCSWCCLKIATTVPFEHKRIQCAMYVSGYNLINYKTYMNQPQTCLIHLWKSMKCTMFKKSSATTGKMLHHGASVQMWRIEKQWSSYISQMSIILGGQILQTLKLNCIRPNNWKWQIAMQTNMDIGIRVSYSGGGAEMSPHILQKSWNWVWLLLFCHRY